jgi:hypothetical protein
MVMRRWYRWTYMGRNTAPDLSFRRMPDDPKNVHVAWTTEGWIKGLDMTSRCKTKHIMISDEVSERNHDNQPAFCSRDRSMKYTHLNSMLTHR